MRVESPSLKNILNVETGERCQDVPSFGLSRWVGDLGMIVSFIKII